MKRLGKDEMAKYPFIPDAGRHLQEYGFDLAQFGSDPALKPIVDRAYERVMASLRGAVYKSELTLGRRALSDSMLDVEIFSFLIAIILIKLANRRTLVQRFALAEARRAEEFLIRDLTDRRDRTRADMALHLLRNTLGLEVRTRSYTYMIPVPDYLQHSGVFNEREWKLVNRHVAQGSVILEPEKAVRLVRHALTSYVSSRISESASPGMIPGFEEMTAALAAEADLLEPSYIGPATGVYPPCIKHAINVLEKGENLPHSGRFMLATYLIARGQSVEEIAPLFKGAPDYSERVTMYQLNHLSGKRGHEKYTCPSCDKLRTQDLCHETAQCAGIITPLQFGRRKVQQGSNSSNSTTTGQPDGNNATKGDPQ